MAKLTITADEKLAVNLIIDLINLHPEFSKEKIKNEFKKNKTQIKTDRFEIIYSIAKRRWIDNRGKIEECENPAKHEPKYIPDIKEYIKDGLENGKTQYQLAKELGVTRPTIQYHKRELEKNISLNKTKTISNKDKLEKDGVLKIDNMYNVTQDDIKNLSEAGIVSDVGEAEIKVYHPGHYNTTNYECWDVFKEIAKEYEMDPAEAAMFFNVFKYIWRYKRKDGVKDLEKASNYIGELIKEISQ